MILTPEQLAAGNFVSFWPAHNLFLEARAGSAKTTTLEHLISALPKSSVLVLAFNKSIQEEIQSRFPSTRSDLVARTFNAIGEACLKSYLGKWPKLREDKMFQLLKQELDKLDQTTRQELGKDAFNEMLSFAKRTKHYGWLPACIARFGKTLITDEEVFEASDIELSQLQWDIIEKICTQSFEMIFKGDIDFDDQVLFPAVMAVSVPKFDVVMVDEAQDLSPVNHMFVQKLAKQGSHVVAVGDVFQAIYGFRGAFSNSMELLKEKIGGETLYLTTCFRCPELIIREAHFRAPDMRWPDGTRLGLVRHWSSWSLSEVEDDAIILCRKNAPLYSLAFKFLRAGRPVQLRGRDVAASLATIIKKLGKENTTSEAALMKLEEYRLANKGKNRDREAFEDKIYCCKIILEQGKTLGAALAAADRLLSIPSRIILMTGHKAKGLQFPNVFILDGDKINLAAGQNANILYVMQTRAQETLTYINLDNLEAT